MFLMLVEICMLVAVIVLPFFIRKNGAKKTIRLPKNHNDTSGARYAINEKGYLEEIPQDRLSRHTN